MAHPPFFKLTNDERWLNANDAGGTGRTKFPPTALEEGLANAGRHISIPGYGTAVRR